MICIMYVKIVMRLLKKEKVYFKTYNHEKLLNEYKRWKRNINLTSNKIYKKEYQLKIIAIAEIVSEKYKENDLINEIIDYSNSQKEVKKETIEISEEQINKNIELLNKDKEVELGNRSTWKKCKDGHMVRSSREMQIDNFLYDNEIVHTYDTYIDIDTHYRTDWYLPTYKVYIEFWGLNTRKYEENRTLKMEYYESHHYNLISIEQDDLCDITKVLIDKLHPYRNKT